jgi:hypothetical protein
MTRSALITRFGPFVALLAVTVILASEARAQVTAFDSSHAAWTEILQRRVKAGVVDYAGLKSEDLGRLDRYLGSLGAVTRETYSRWNRTEKLAFWINVYNVFTVKLILDHYPLKSIRSIGFLPGAAFRESFIKLPGLRQTPYSLNDVENEVLRKEFTEPRIHFAIVCASKSCPALRSEAYRGTDLEAQLDAAARSFLGDSTKNRLDGETLRLSSIFKWFSADFEKSAGSVARFVSRYLTLDPGRSYEIVHLDYDWSLNGR